MNLDQEKKLVFWGTGVISNKCLKQFPDVRPQFFIDSNWNSTEKFYDIPVRRPDEIGQWCNLFIVVVASEVVFEKIGIFLKAKGLEKDRDYKNYEDFFGYHCKNITESLTFMEEFIHEHVCYEGATLIFAPVFKCRISDIMISFFREYEKKKTMRECVLFTPLEFMHEKEAAKLMGFPVFDIPQICMWSGRKRIGKFCELERGIGYEQELLPDERDWLEYMETRKISENRELSLKITTKIYLYYKKVFDIFRPKEVIIWGGWRRISYILAEISKRNKIPYGFMEHGWIPGTFQFDRGGIAGQSEYAVNPEKILNLTIKNKEMNVKAIREYIIKVQLDHGKFRTNDLDEKNFSLIDKKNKTVFFVGMDDYGMGMDPLSKYWTEYISAYFHSTFDAVLYIAKICERNQWNFVFKPHPGKVMDIGTDPDKLPSNLIFIKDMKIDRLIEIADVVVSITSAVDYKALIYGKPLVSLGHTTLYKKGCCYEPENMKDIEIQLKMAVENGMTEEQDASFERHVAQLLENYLWDDLTVRDLRYGLSLETDFFK